MHDTSLRSMKERRGTRRTGDPVRAFLSSRERGEEHVSFAESAHVKVDPEWPWIGVHEYLELPQLLRRRSATETVRHRAGLVQIFNTPGDDFDYLVSIVPSEDGVKVEAMAVLARDDGPSVSASAIRSARTGEAIGRAKRALSRVMSDDDGDVADLGVADMRLVSFESTNAPSSAERATSRQVEEDAVKVAEEWKAWVDAGSVGSYRKAIAESLGWGSSDKARRRVARALTRAERLGLGIPAAKGTRERQ